MSDLTAEEQKNVRAALRFLRVRLGAVQFAKAMHASREAIRYTLAGKYVSASMAFRAARLAGVGVDALLAGEYPPAGTCPHCGHRREETSR